MNELGRSRTALLSYNAWASTGTPPSSRFDPQLVCIVAEGDCPNPECGCTTTLTLHDVRSEKPPPPTINYLACSTEVPIVSVPGRAGAIYDRADDQRRPCRCTR